MVASYVSHPQKTMTTIVTVIGYDRLAEAGNLTSAPQSQLLIARVDKILKGKEKAKYIKIIYEYFSSEETHLKALLSDEKHQWKFVLSRNKRCDSTLKEAKYAKGIALDGAKEIMPVLLLKDVGGLEAISESTNLPCYSLKSDGIKSQR
jgi:hypothetical protein